MSLDDNERAIELEERRWYFHGFRQIKGGAAYGLQRSPDNQWIVSITLPDRDNRRLFGVPDYESGLRAQDYCTRHDTLVKIALIELDQNGNPEQMQKLRAEAIEWGELPRRRMRLTIEVDVDMRGTNAEIQYYVETSIRSAANVTGAKCKFIEGPEIREPRPQA